MVSAPLERNPSACHCPTGGSNLSLRLRTPTMTPAIAPFNSRRKYQVHPRTAASGPRRPRRGWPEGVGPSQRRTGTGGCPGVAAGDRVLDPAVDGLGCRRDCRLVDPWTGETSPPLSATCVALARRCVSSIDHAPRWAVVQWTSNADAPRGPERRSALEWSPWFPWGRGWRRCAGVGAGWRGRRS